MRTNLDIDDKLLKRAMAVSGEPTKKATIEKAMRLAIQLKKQERIKRLFGKVQWEGDLSEMRRSRFPDWDSSAGQDDSSADEPAA